MIHLMSTYLSKIIKLSLFILLLICTSCTIIDDKKKEVITYEVKFIVIAVKEEKIIEVEENTYCEEYIPERYGYTFLGWYIDEELNNKFDFENTLIKEDIVLYSKWERQYGPIL